MQERKSKNRDEWLALIEEQSKSGLSKIKFCQEKGITISRFNYHQSQLRIVEHQESVEDRSKSFRSAIIPIQIKNEIPKRAEKEYQIKLLLKNGLECILPSAMDKTSLKEIIEVLASC